MNENNNTELDSSLAEQTFSVNVHFTKSQILEFFGNLAEMYRDSEEKFLDETFCISDSEKKKIQSKQNLGYAYVYVNDKGDKYITLGQGHADKLMAGIQYHLNHSPQTVINQLQKMLFSTGRAQELMENTTDYGSEELFLETMIEFQAPTKEPSIKI